MPLNITPIITQLEQRISAADSSSNINELLTLSRLVHDYSNYNMVAVQSRGDLRSPDSSAIGEIVYVRDVIDDSFGSFYMGNSDSWDKINLNADSNEIYGL